MTRNSGSGSRPLNFKPAPPPAPGSLVVVATRAQVKPSLDQLRLRLRAGSALGSTVNAPKGGIASSREKVGSGSRTAPGKSNEEVRAWYNAQLKAINTSGPLTRQTAARVHAERNALKQRARDMMEDRAAAAQLDEEQPVQSLESYIEKYSKQGYTGKALWKKIIEGGTTPNKAVNKKYGIK